MSKWNSPHKHKCPDCGKEYDCVLNKWFESCGVEYDKYPCENCFGKHCLFMSDTPQGAEELHKNGY